VLYACTATPSPRSPTTRRAGRVPRTGRAAAAGVPIPRIDGQSRPGRAARGTDPSGDRSVSAYLGKARRVVAFVDRGQLDGYAVATRTCRFPADRWMACDVARQATVPHPPRARAIASMSKEKHPDPRARATAVADVLRVYKLPCYGVDAERCERRGHAGQCRETQRGNPVKQQRGAILRRRASASAIRRAGMPLRPEGFSGGRIENMRWHISSLVCAPRRDARQALRARLQRRSPECLSQGLRSRP